MYEYERTIIRFPNCHTRLAEVSIRLYPRDDFSESKVCETIEPDMVAERIIGVARHDGDMYLLTKCKNIPEPVYVNSKLAKLNFAPIYIKYLEDNTVLA